MVNREKFEKSERIVYIDYLRALGMIYVIMGHIHFGELFEHYIYSFHMPLFFFISGMFYKPNQYTFRVYIIKKIKSIIIPYLSFGILYEIIAIPFHEANWAGLIWSGSIMIPIAGSLWFLSALFICEIIGAILIKYLSATLAVIITIMISLTGCIFHFELPFAACSAFVGLGFWVTAYFISPYIIDFFYYIYKKTNKFTIVLIILLFYFQFLSAIYSPRINMRQNIYPNIAAFWINSLSAIIIYFYIFLYIDNVLDKFKKSKFSRFICSIGRNSIVYLCVHQAVIQFIKIILFEIGIDLFYEANICVNFIALFIVILICFVASLIFAHKYFCFFLGKID